MGKTSDVQEDGASGQVDRHRTKVLGRAAEREAEEQGAAAEHLQQDFARVRAKSATDPALAPRTLSAAWTTDVMEEDEAEFVDAVADCLGAGFSLESALTGWDMGTLAADERGDGAPFDDDVEHDEQPPLVAPAFAQRHTGGRRFVVT